MVLITGTSVEPFIRPTLKEKLYQMTQDYLKLLKSYRHVTLMSPSFQTGTNLHLLTSRLTLDPASGDEGEFVALPLSIQAPVSVVELLMVQTVLPSPTRRNLGSPSTFLKTGRPLLHLPTSNLLQSAINPVCLDSF